MVGVYRTVIVVLALLCSVGYAAAVQDLMALQGNVLNSTGGAVDGDLLVVIYDASTGGNLIYNSSSDFDGSIINGQYDVVLGSGASEVSLVFGQVYYMDLMINAEDLDFSGSERQVFQANVGNITRTTQLAEAAGELAFASGAANASGDYSAALGLGDSSGWGAFSAGSSVASGRESVALGEESTASGNSSVAMVEGTASGASSVAIGGGATGYSSIALGRYVNSFSLGSGSYSASVTSGHGAIALQGGNASGNNSFALGGEAYATKNHSVVLGYHGEATGKEAICLGSGIAAGLRSFSAMSGEALGNYSIAMGQSASASGNSATAIAGSAQGNFATAIGVSTIAAGEYSISMGYDTVASSSGDIAMGIASTADGIADDDAVSIAMGAGANASGAGSIAIGTQSHSSGSSSFSAGDQTNATGDYSVALGDRSQARGDAAMAAGHTSAAVGNYSLAVGYNAEAWGNGSIALGYDTTADGRYAIAIGEGNSVLDNKAVALGSDNEVAEYGAMAIGVENDVSGNSGYAVGEENEVSGEQSYAFGGRNIVSGYQSTALGTRANVSGNNSMVISLDDTYRAVSANNMLAILGGNVSVGKVSASAELDVNGTVRATQICDETGANCKDISTGWDADSVWTQNGSDVYVNGSVGIGTTSPVALLSLEDDDDAGIYLFSPQLAHIQVGSGLTQSADITMVGSSASRLQMSDGSGNWSWTMRNDNNDFLIEDSVGSGKLKITQSGKVGVGTSVPNATLDVNGTVRAQEICDETGANCKDISAGWAADSIWSLNGTGVFAGDNTASGDYSFAVGDDNVADGDNSIAMGESSEAGGDNSVAIGFAAIASGAESIALGTAVYADGIASIAMGVNSEASGDGSVAIGEAYALNEKSFALGNDIIVNGTYSMGIGLDEVQRTIQSPNLLAIVGGNVSIGKVINSATLDVNGTINAEEICDETGANCKDISTGWDADSVWTQNGSDVYLNGSVGIGTETPTALLSLEDDDDAGIYLFSPQLSHIQVGGTLGQTAELALIGSAASRIQLQDGSGNWSWTLRNDNNDLLIEDSIGSGKFKITQAGTVGIGTSLPNATLDVNGSAIINGSDVSGDGDVLQVVPSATWGRGILVGDSDSATRYARLSEGFLTLFGDASITGAGVDNFIGFQNDDESWNIGLAPTTVFGSPLSYRMYISEEVDDVFVNRFVIQNDSGYVGIHTNDPQATLDVNGTVRIDSLLQLVPTDNPGDCEAETFGAIYVDDSLSLPCFCDGANWSKFDGSACS